MPGTVSTTNNLNSHKYQNLTLFEGDHSNFGTLPSRIPQLEVVNRPHSSMSIEQTNHSYLNSAGHNVIEIPLSCQNSHFEGSKTSVNAAGSGKALTETNSFDSSTLSCISGNKNVHHEYVNSNIYNDFSLDDSFMNKRKNSEQHLNKNYEVPFQNTLSKSKKLGRINPNMTASDDLSTFCYVNLDLDSVKQREILLQSKLEKL